MPINPTGPPSFTLADAELLEGDEIIAVVDDLPDITNLLLRYFRERGFAAEGAHNAAELGGLLESRNIALVILDIELPDASGVSLLPELKARFPNTAVVMLTAAANLETALACLRRGADDYLTKPVRLDNLMEIARGVLEKRRLTLRGRGYREQLESARKGIDRTLALNLRMSLAYLSISGLDRLMRAVLTGITAHEGLGFNRAILLLYNEKRTRLVGRHAIGPVSLEEGVAIWQGMAVEHLTLDALLRRLEEGWPSEDTPIAALARGLSIDASDGEHIMVRALRERRIIVVREGRADCPVPEAASRLLGTDSFVVAPLCLPERELGVVVADNFVSRRPFEEIRLRALESFLAQAGLALEHGRLYQEMLDKVADLEEATRALHNNNEMLVTAGRYSALGHMAAQLTHNLRNPLTAIGGAARLLSRRGGAKGQRRFFDVMVDEVAKAEKVLDDLDRFVETIQPVYERVSLTGLAKSATLLYRREMLRRGIALRLDCPERLPDIEADPKLIQQAVVHLIANAIDAMPEGGELGIAIAPERGGQSLAVTDTGGGISPAIMDNVRDPFFTTKTVGTGLGLSLVQRILKDHGGDLALSNNPGGGAAARIWLPESR